MDIFHHPLGSRFFDSLVMIHHLESQMKALRTPSQPSNLGIKAKINRLLRGSFSFRSHHQVVTQSIKDNQNEEK